MNAALLLLIAAQSLRPFPSMRDVGMRPDQGAPPGVTISAMPYTRTVTASNYTLTGTSTDTLGTDASAASVVLDLTFGGLDGATSIVDRSPSPKAMTAFGDAQVDTAQFKWGQASYIGDGSGDRYTTPDSADFDFGSGDFTIELWTRWASATGFPTIITQLNAAANTELSFYFGHDVTNKMLFYAIGDDTLASVFLDSASASGYTPALNTWIHLAVVRNGSTFKMYADGVEIASASATNTGDIRDSANPVRIGDAQDACGSCSFNGHMDGLRVTKGVARYTAAFTPAEYQPGEVYWSASPATVTGPCTGTDTFSCVVTVTPDATGEGVETITVTRGAASDTETIGFYVAGAHSVFLAQSINGLYNVGMADLDAVAQWENVGSSALDVTQAVGTAQPKLRTSIVGGQPVVRCDGGDRVAATTASDWTFMHDGTDWTIEHIGATATAGADGVYVTNVQAATNHGTASVRVAGLMYLQMFNATPTLNFLANTAYSDTVFHLVSDVLNDDGGAGIDLWMYLDAAAAVTAIRASTYSVTAAQPLNLCAYNNATRPLTGDLFRVLIYQSALDATQRGINLAVDEWALGGTLPVTP